MRRAAIILLLTVLTCAQVFAYNDHRGHNLDSLERVVAKWTPDAIDKGSDEEMISLNNAYRNLMLGYQKLNQEKFLFYARKALSVSKPRGWRFADADAYRYIGQYFYFREQWDSAGVYFNAIRKITEAKHCRELGAYQCKGYDTYGPFKFVGGIAKGHPNGEEINGAVEFYQAL